MLTLTDTVLDTSAQPIRPSATKAAALTCSPRVWLGGVFRAGRKEPSLSTWLRDDQMRIWIPNGRGTWFTTDRLHQATLDELRSRTDLVEIPAR